MWRLSSRLIRLRGLLISVGSRTATINWWRIANDSRFISSNWPHPSRYHPKRWRSLWRAYVKRTWIGVWRLPCDPSPCPRLMRCTRGPRLISILRMGADAVRFASTLPNVRHWISVRDAMCSLLRATDGAIRLLGTAAGQVAVTVRMLAKATLKQIYSEISKILDTIETIPDPRGSAPPGDGHVGDAGGTAYGRGGAGVDFGSADRGIPTGMRDAPEAMPPPYSEVVPQASQPPVAGAVREMTPSGPLSTADGTGGSRGSRASLAPAERTAAAESALALESPAAPREPDGQPKASSGTGNASATPLTTPKRPSSEATGSVAAPASDVAGDAADADLLERLQRLRNM